MLFYIHQLQNFQNTEKIKSWKVVEKNPGTGVE